MQTRPLAFPFLFALWIAGFELYSPFAAHRVREDRLS
jgi:hypothetical protein